MEPEAREAEAMIGSGGLPLRGQGAEGRIVEVPGRKSARHLWVNTGFCGYITTLHYYIGKRHRHVCETHTTAVQTHHQPM